MSTPHLHLRTLFVFNDEGRIVSTREPGATPGPLFGFIRSATSCAWAIRADVPNDLADELARLAREEPPASNLRDAPVHAPRYIALLAGRIGPVGVTKTRQSDGPAFEFPRSLASLSDIAVVEHEALLQNNFKGWVPGEIAAGRAPVMAIIEDGQPVSIYFCARLSDAATEAGLETAEAYRGRGYGPRVTAAWAMAIRASGRIPLYSTSWTNNASLAVARKVGLAAYASAWVFPTDVFSRRRSAVSWAGLGGVSREQAQRRRNQQSVRPSPHGHVADNSGVSHHGPGAARSGGRCKAGRGRRRNRRCARNRRHR